MRPPRVRSPTALPVRPPPPVTPNPRCSQRRRRGASRLATRTDWPRRRRARAATREPKQAVRKTTCLTLLSDDSLSERSSPEHDKAGEELITTDLPGFCPAVWRPDVCRPLAALGPDPLSWIGGTLATERFYLPLFRMTNDAEPNSVISFTNALPTIDSRFCDSLNGMEAVRLRRSRNIPP